uniref:PIR2-like helical domain-containing protein n=1 Tax=Oryza glaberrima TaxID=4538 RepID=I1QTT7_ORYGL
MAEQPIIGHSPEANTLSPTSSPLPLPPITIHAPPFTRALHHAASSFPLLPPHRSHRRKGAAVARIGIEPAMGRRQQPAASGASPSSATASQKSLIPQIQRLRRGGHSRPSGFMTSYFRYLPTLEALNFLCAAEGDLLAAVHLVEAERCMSCAFDIGSCTARTALRCTAGAAGHRDPGRVASEMLSLFSKAYKIASHLLSRTADRLTCSAILVLVPPRLPPELAAFSPLASLGVTVKDERTLERCTKSLQSVLVDKIHGFYLEALALLPQHLLRGRYHRSVVMAGHCYGPLDPASNIILNTIWYDAAFPVPKEQHLDLDMIGRWALIRAECCSIAGLVAGLAGDYNPSELQAIRCLLYANGDFATAMSGVSQILPRGCAFRHRVAVTGTSTVAWDAIGAGCPGSGLGLPGTGWKGREVALAPWPKEKGGRKQKREEEEEEEEKKKKKKKRSGKGRERKEKGIREKSGDFSGIFEIFKENLGY